MENFDILCPYLPQEWVAALEKLPLADRYAVQELRLRAGQPVMLSTPVGERFLLPVGATDLCQPEVYRCSALQLEQCFMRFCEESLYAHEQELRQGFIAVPGGIGVGVAGTAVLGERGIHAVSQVTSLCIRLPRAHPGCAAGLLPLVLSEDTLRSMLLVGEPSSGKTTLLRDLAVSLAARRLRVTVVDERGEIGGVENLPGCDVLQGYPKTMGIRQAIRCLAPQVILFDEMGGEDEMQAVIACAHAGVAVIASLHGHDPLPLGQKPAIFRLVKEQVFENWVFLAGRRAPGRWAALYGPEVREDEIYWHAVDGAFRDRSRAVLFQAADKAGEFFAAVGTATGYPTTTADLYGAPSGNFVAGVGGWRCTR